MGFRREPEAQNNSQLDLKKPHYPGVRLHKMVLIQIHMDCGDVLCKLGGGVQASGLEEFNLIYYVPRRSSRTALAHL